MHRREHSGTSGLGRGPGRHVRRLAFWLAILLPASYGPLLAVGLDGRTGPILAGLAGLNLLCLLVGHDHSP